MAKKIKPLSAKKVETAKAVGKDIKLYDGDGLLLLVKIKGGKWWRFNYRFDSKAKTISFGTFPEVSLEMAREKRAIARKHVANGVDPGALRKVEKDDIKLATNNFEAVAREWHKKNAEAGQWTPGHATVIINRLTKEVFPWLGQKPLSAITAPELLEVLLRVSDRGALDTAHRIRHNCDLIFCYAIAHGLAIYNIVPNLKGAMPKVHNNNFAAPITPNTVAPLLRAIDGYVGSFVVKCALQLAPLLFVRPGELRNAEWAEINFAAAIWEIPALKMKMKNPHVVPLARQAIAVLRVLHPLTGSGKYVFPCHRSPLRCMSENAVNAGLRRMGFEKKEITGHGFRATARTMLAELLHTRPDLLEHQLAHSVKDANGTAYNRTSFLPERKEIMQKWADYLDKLKNGAEIIPIRVAAG